MCREILAERRKLTTNPLTSIEGVSLQVDDVYVPLGLVERKKQSKRQGDISPEQGSELYKETEITKTFEHNAFLEEVLKQKNTPKSQGKRIAIIGEPGAGKTTLLQQIADWVYREIDQSMVIWVSLADLRGKKLKPYLFETWLTQVAEKTGKAKATEQLKNDFVDQFNQGRVWLLLDGLDEMSVSVGNHLTEIKQQISHGGCISQARIVLTCRVNVWDGNTNVLDDFDIYRTLNFSYPEQVEAFIYKWFTPIPEAGVEAEKQLCQDLKEAGAEAGKKLCQDLKEPGKERIQDLVKNPLRLTLLCFNWQSGENKLPDTQAGIYEQFVNRFYKWKDWQVEASDKQEELNDKLGELAKKAIDEKSTVFRLQQDFVSEYLGKIDNQNSLLNLALKLGWLNCVGIDRSSNPVYAFFHASFQEYFAAIVIDDWHFFLKHVPHNPSQGIYRIFEPQWKQTILLWLGRDEEKLKHQKQEFIDALVNFKDGCQKCYEYRAYFLAAAGIAEFRDYFRADEIVAQIVKWIIDSQRLIKEEASSALQQTDRTKAIAALEELLQSTTIDEYTRWQVADSLWEIGTGNEIVAALEELLQSSTVDEDTRRQAAMSLEIIDPGNEIVIAALEELLQSSTVDEDTRRYAAMSLGKIGTANEFAITALVQMLQSSTVDKVTRMQAAKSLGKIDSGNEFAIAALEKLLQSKTVDYFTRWLAAESLGRIDSGNEFASAFLEELLQSTTVSDFIRRQAADSLGEIDPGNKFASAALEELLQSTTVSDFIRRQAADSLGEIGTGNKLAITVFVELLQSTTVDEDTRRLVAESLGKIDPGNEFAIAALEELLQSTTLDEDTRRQAADSLGKIDPGNEFASAALEKLLQSTTVDEDTRRLVAKSLGRIDTGNEFAIAALVELLQSTTVSDFTRMRVADSLEKIGTDNEFASATLEELLQPTNVSDFTLWLVADSLGRIDPGNKFAVAALVELLQSTTVNDVIHTRAAESLGEIIQNNQDCFEVVKTLSSYWRLDDEFHNLAWKCAQNMTYPDFYQAWHQHNLATRAMRSLKKILFTKII
ncbi:HEAT repeat domain-containing protein [Anabaena sp. CCY 0017]|uniref:HEAT repeat domain-containing protein n=1 Tax=Anabaena sp. CCY 0017 TaxID=3103866 RepID=UPI0039C7004A